MSINISGYRGNYTNLYNRELPLESRSKTVPTKHRDTVEISAEAYKSQESDEKNVPPKIIYKGVDVSTIDVDSIDWDNYDLPILECGPKKGTFEKAYFDSYGKTLTELMKKIEQHYAAEQSKIDGMNYEEAYTYVWSKYKLPFMQDVFIQGTVLPDPPAGMSEKEADMAYNQIMQGRFSATGYSLYDPYALGQEGIEKLKNLDKSATSAAEKACEESVKKQEELGRQAAIQKEKKLINILKNISSGMGKMESMGTIERTDRE